MRQFDVVIIGSGPAGQTAALTAARAGRTAAIIEKDRAVGGACLHRGTVPSKTLREAALRLSAMQADARSMGASLPAVTTIDILTARLGEVTRGHADVILEGFEALGIARVHGTARVVADDRVEVVAPGGAVEVLVARVIIVASGSIPRLPPGFPIDHEQVLDSDSILSLTYLPKSLTIVGAGVIACEYASIFAELGTTVTIVDAGERPLSFLDPELSEAFAAAFAGAGGTYIGGATVESMVADGFATVSTTLADGTLVTAERAMVALGRVPCTRGLGLAEIGVEQDSRDRVVVDAHCRTSRPSVYAVGDVIGAPGLASTSMEQGRRAVRHALGLEPGRGWQDVPIGVYTIPEIAAVGLTEPQAREQHGDVLIGRSEFRSLARGHIAGDTSGFLKLIADPQGEVILGVGIVGDGAAELISVGQVAKLLGGSVLDFVENIFNFPTRAEAYRVAALDVLQQRSLRANRAA